MVVVHRVVEFPLWFDLMVGSSQFNGDLEGDYLLYGVVFHHQFWVEVVFLSPSIVEELFGVVFLLGGCFDCQRRERDCHRICDGGEGMIWACFRLFGFRFTARNWLGGIFGRWRYRNQRDEYRLHLKSELRAMVQRWYLMEKEEQRDENLIVVGVLATWVMLRAFPEDQTDLMVLMQKEIRQRVMWLESGL